MLKRTLIFRIKSIIAETDKKLLVIRLRYHRWKKLSHAKLIIEHEQRVTRAKAVLEYYKEKTPDQTNDQARIGR